MNQLFYGDNLQVLRDSIATESVDLVYLDPPFNSQANYNVLFKAPSGAASEAQIEAFDDTWHWNASAESVFDEVMHSRNSAVAEMLNAFRSFLRESDMMAYLTMMAVRLLELHRVLKPSGSLYLHCDPTASHYLKIVLDGVFGIENYRNEIVWQRTSSHNDPKKFGRVHDLILFYSKSTAAQWNTQYDKQDADFFGSHDFEVDEQGKTFRKRDLTAPYRGGASGQYEWKGKMPTKGRMWSFTKENMERLDEEGRIVYTSTGMPRLKIYVEDLKGLPLQDVWASPDLWLNSAAKERLGYPTQKPLALLDRIIKASSNEGDIVLDPFCGCGTTIHSAQRLRRQWIGIDITHLAISLIEKRLGDAFPGIAFEVQGTPKDLEGAQALARADKYQFQWWAVSLVDAVPYGGKKKGADSGIDGFIYFKPDGKNTEKAIVSVKGGENIGVAMIRDLAHVVDREKAKIGLLISLVPPTKPMLVEAVKVGYFDTPFGRYAKIQILTIEELFAGKQPNIPLVEAIFRKAAEDSTAVQATLL